MEAIQHAKETTAVDLAALLDACEDAIVTLVAGDTRLVAHRAVLMDRSPVFNAMFRHDTLESGSGQVTIADVEGPVLRQLLSYLYTMRAPQLPADMAPKLLAAADKYEVASLKAACEQQVAAQLSVETAVATALLAIGHSCDNLRRNAINFIKDHSYQVMATQAWDEAVHSHPKEVVEVTRLLSSLPAESSMPSPAVSGSSASPRTSTQPDSHRKRHCRTPASAALTTADYHHTPAPDDAVVSRLRGLPAEERSRRLIQVARNISVGELEALLAAGADVAATDGNGWTALHWAARWGRVEAARRLVARGAPLEARDSRLMTPLHRAAAYGQTAVARLLLDASAHHSPRNKDGQTPLHEAAGIGDVELATLLLEADADRRARDNEGQTPLDLARRCNHPQLVALLTRA